MHRLQPTGEHVLRPLWVLGDLLHARRQIPPIPLGVSLQERKRPGHSPGVMGRGHVELPACTTLRGH